MRQNGRRPFDEKEFKALKAYAPVVSAAMVRHWGQPTGSSRPDPEPARLERAFLTFEQEKLSPREQEIVSLVLRGHSSHSIGLVLGIAEGTVKNHRKHIHSKLQVSSQSELFALFISHLDNLRTPKA